jgi:hypothetical protein
MSIRRRIGLLVMALTLMGLAWAPGQSWGQTAEQIGTVLAVDGTAEVRVANATTWEPLQFRATLFLNDTVRTAADSKVKILLRDDSIVTLAERGEMRFTEFLLTPQQRRTVINLALGKLKMITSTIFGAGSVTEVRTANTVAGVRGTTFVVIFIPPEETDVIALDGVVAVQNPNLPQLEPVPANFLTQVIGDSAPSRATELLPSDRQTLDMGLRLTEQIPVEVKPSIERQATGPIRGEPPAAGPSTPFVPEVPRVVALPAGVQPGQQDAAAQLNHLLAHTTTVNTVNTSEPLQTRGAPVITPDNPQTINTIQRIQSPQPPLSLTISFPR